MYSIYDRCLATAGVIPVLLAASHSHPPSSSVNLPPSLLTIAASMKACLDMYGQEYVLKETIASCLMASLNDDSYVTINHVSGFLSVWTTQPYLEPESVEALKTSANRLD